MAAVIQIEQVGLAAGTAGKTRTDGLDNGALVTVTSVGAGTTHTLEIEWVGPGDTTTVTSLVQVDPTTWTFSPTAGVYGTWRLKLTVDGVVTRRLFAVRLPITGLRIPALNERASSLATLLTASPALIEDSEHNEDLAAPFDSGNYGGYYPDLRDLYLQVETNAGSLVPTLAGTQYAVLMEDPVGTLVFQPLTEDMIAAGFNISSFTKTAPNGGTTTYRRGDTLTGLTASAAYTSSADGASIVNVLGGSAGGGDIAPGAWTILTPFTSASMAGSVLREGTDLGADPTLQVQLTANKGAFVQNASYTVRWTRDVYFGVGVAGLNTEVQIEALASSTLATSRNRTITVSPSNEKVYYAYPKSYGTATFTLSGFPAAFNAAFDLSMTNSNGITSTYSIYESVNLLTGTNLNFVVT